MYRLHQQCRACDSTELIPVFDLGVQPLANDFCRPGESRAGYAPLTLLFCPKCTLAQLSVVVDPKVLYPHYSYVTSQSRTMQDHFTSICNDIQSETEGRKVFEIGSNDGYLLYWLQQHGFGPVLGIDPAENLCHLASLRGFTTINSLFNAASIREHEGFLKAVDVIIARHVFCHIDNWHEFISNIESICHRDTLVCIEVPYVVDTLFQSQFDQIYHEHLSYLSVQAMVALLSGTSLRLHRIIDYPVHGGSMMMMLRKRDFPKSPHESVGKMLEIERAMINLENWKEFSSQSNYKIGRLRIMVDDFIQKGHSVAGFGASAKSTVWVNACKFRSNQVEFITDTTPQKIGTVSPGTNIPIVDQHELTERLPDYAILFAWNFLSNVLEDQSAYIQWGGKFIVPTGNIEVVPKP